MSARFRSLEELRAAVGRAVSIAGVQPKPTQAPKRQPRYLNQKCSADGHEFDSKLELTRYRELQEMLRAGTISELRVHTHFALHAPRRNAPPARIGSYEADFDYRWSGELVVEDCKSARTRSTSAYRWKKRHFELEYGIEITEIQRPWRRKRSGTA